jgi:hypothetical protein
MARMEHEMESICRDFKMIEDSHGENVLSLVIVVGPRRPCGAKVGTFPMQEPWEFPISARDSARYSSLLNHHVCSRWAVHVPAMMAVPHLSRRSVVICLAKAAPAVQSAQDRGVLF